MKHQIKLQKNKPKRSYCYLHDSRRVRDHAHVPYSERHVDVRHDVRCVVTSKLRVHALQLR